MASAEVLLAAWTLREAANVADKVNGTPVGSPSMSAPGP